MSVAVPVLAISGLAREARIAAGEDVETVQAGGNPKRLRKLLEARTTARPHAVISFGIAGGLDPALAPGDLVVATGIIGEKRIASDPDLVRAYAARLSGLASKVVAADLAGVDEAVMTTGAKSELHGATGAAAVDMESHVAAAWALAQGVPFCALRVICDPADRALPAFAATALKPNGDPDIKAVLAALIRREAKLSELIRLARDSGAAFASLRRARALLGLALGVDA